MVSGSFRRGDVGMAMGRVSGRGFSAAVGLFHRVRDPVLPHFTTLTRLCRQCFDDYDAGISGGLLPIWFCLVPSNRVSPFS